MPYDRVPHFSLNPVVTLDIPWLRDVRVGHAKSTAGEASPRHDVYQTLARRAENSCAGERRIPTF